MHVGRVHPDGTAKAEDDDGGGMNNRDLEDALVRAWMKMMCASLASIKNVGVPR